MNKQKVGSDESNNNVISLKLLGSLTVSFLTGYFIHNIVVNSNNLTVYSFSTPDLINFILSVLLSGASIVLAVSAISLGKFSEQAMIQRSDESIRLQNEVFQKTTEALQRIESSTGVTEKRLEDIISGRVGDLSEKIVRIAAESTEEDSNLQPKEIEDLIRKTLLQSLNDYGVLSGNTSTYEDEERQGSVQRESKKYRLAHEKLEEAITKRDDLRALKLGQGDAKESGLKLFDNVVVNKNNQKIGIIDFPASNPTSNIKRLAIENALKELRSDTVNFVRIIVYEPNKILQYVFDEIVSIIDPVLKAKISYSVCRSDQVDEFVQGLADL